MTIEDKSRQIIKNAEKSKAMIFQQSGKRTLDRSDFTAKMDEDYLVIGAHVDECTQAKITKGEYIDFGKLIPKDKIVSEEDGWMELIMKNGKAYWVPVTGESTNISNFQKWEQAFRIYCNVYTSAHPHRASELIQYNHIIHTISMTYVWDNVYAYDKEFRMHLARHPECSWAIILQQAWSMRLKDRREHWPNSGGNPNQFNNHAGGIMVITMGVVQRWFLNPVVISIEASVTLVRLVSTTIGALTVVNLGMDSLTAGKLTVTRISR